VLCIQQACSEGHQFVWLKPELHYPEHKWISGILDHPIGKEKPCNDYKYSKANG
jgi:hypothetical protein